MQTAGLERRIRELESRVRTVTEERDALARDVESLCLQGSGASMFSGGSYVLTERLRAAESEARDARQKAAALEEAHTQLSSELTETRAELRTVQASLAYEQERANRLAGEREFHAAAHARLLAETDTLTQEAAGLRTSLQAAEGAARAAEGRAEAEGRGRTEAEAAAAARQAALTQARQEGEARAAEVTALTRQLRASTDAVHRLEAAQSHLTTRLAAADAEIQRAREAARAGAESEARMGVQLREARASGAALQGTVGGQAEVITDLQSQLDQLQASSGEAARAAAATEAQLRADLAAALEQVEEQANELRGRDAELRTLQATLEQVRASQREREEAVARAMTRAAAPATPHPAAAHQPGILGEDGRGAGHETGQGADVGLQHSTAKALDPAAGVSDGSGGAGGTGDAGAGGGGEAGGGAVSQPVSGLSAAEAAAALEAEEVADVREQAALLAVLVRDLKVKLAQATAEKVDALLAAADLQHQLDHAHAQLAACPPAPAPTATSHALHPHNRAVSLPIRGAAPAAVPGASAAALLQPSHGTSPSALGAGWAAMVGSRLLGLGRSATLGGGVTSVSNLGLPGGHQLTTGTGVGAASGAGDTGSSGRSGSSNGTAGDGASEAPTPQSGEGTSGASGGDAAGMEGGTGRGEGGTGGAGADSTTADRILSHAHASGPTSPGHAASASPATGRVPVDQRAAAAAVAARRAATAAAHFAAHLRAAARVLIAGGGEDGDASKKWAVLGELSRLGEELARTRARLGLPPPRPLTSPSSPPPSARWSALGGEVAASTSHVQAGGGGIGAAGRQEGGHHNHHQSPGEPELMAEVLGLVDFGLAALEAYNRQQALSSVMAMQGHGG